MPPKISFNGRKIFWIANKNSMNTLIILITHAPTASAFHEALDAMRFPYDKRSLLCIDVPNSANPKATAEHIQQQAQPYASVLILTDLIGSTPFHIAKQLCALLTNKSVRIVTGVNLAMLLKAINYQSLPTEELSTKILLGATESILIH